MAGRAAGLIVVIDASTFVSAALKANNLPERALLRAVDPPNRLILSQAVEDEYREVIFRAKFDRFVSVERRHRILDIVVVADRAD
jgi:predicted nucleic acid-binding protein